MMTSLLRIDVLAERVRDLGWREGEDRLFLVGGEGERAAGVQVRDDLPGDRRVAGAAHFLGFDERLFRVGDFLVGRAVLEEPLQFFHDRGGDLVDVRRVGADGHRQRGHRIAGRRGERRGRAVRKPVLLANPVAEPRGERAAAEDEVADPQRGVVRVAVRERERKPGEVFRVRLVGRDDVFLQSRPVVGHLVVDPLVRHLRFPAGQHLLHEPQRALRVKVADDAQLGVRAADLRFVKRLDLFERDVLGAVERFLERRHIAHVVLRVRRQRAAELVSGQGGRFGAAGGEHRGHAELRGFELLRGEGRLAEDLAEQLERLRERVPFGFDGEGQLPRGTAAAAATATAATPAAAAAATRCRCGCPANRAPRAGPGDRVSSCRPSSGRGASRPRSSGP